MQLFAPIGRSEPTVLTTVVGEEWFERGRFGGEIRIFQVPFDAKHFDGLFRGGGAFWRCGHVAVAVNIY